MKNTNIKKTVSPASHSEKLAASLEPQFTTRSLVSTCIHTVKFDNLFLKMGSSVRLGTQNSPREGQERGHLERVSHPLKPRAASMSGRHSELHPKLRQTIFLKPKLVRSYLC